MIQFNHENCIKMVRIHKFLLIGIIYILRYTGFCMIGMPLKESHLYEAETAFFWSKKRTRFVQYFKKGDRERDALL